MTHTGPDATFTPLRVMCAAIADMSIGGVMNLRIGRRRALHGIERDLARSDPGLGMLFFAFTKQVRGEKMPRTEKITSAPLRLLARSRPQSARRRAAEDRRAWPRAIP